MTSEHAEDESTFSIFHILVNIFKIIYLSIPVGILMYVYFLKFVSRFFKLEKFQTTIIYEGKLIK